MKSCVINKNRPKINRCEKINKLQIFGVFFFNRSMQGRDGYRLNPTTSIQELKHAFCRTYFTGFETRFC